VTKNNNNNNKTIGDLDKPLKRKSFLKFETRIDVEIALVYHSD
jgi:hypothetical protein